MQRDTPGKKTLVEIEAAAHLRQDAPSGKFPGKFL
jgi:hypothetical protein